MSRLKGANSISEAIQAEIRNPKPRNPNPEIRTPTWRKAGVSAYPVARGDYSISAGSRLGASLRTRYRGCASGLKARRSSDSVGREFADFQVAERDFAAMFLQQNVAVRPFTEIGDILELA